MSPALGTISYAQEDMQEKSYSQRTNRVIDQEIQRIINERYEECHELLEGKRDLIER
jgi:AFG3 family protein